MQGPASAASLSVYARIPMTPGRRDAPLPAYAGYCDAAVDAGIADD